MPQSKAGELPWRGKGDIPISQDLRQLIKDKKRFHRKWIKAITKEHENSARHQYNTIRNKVKRKMIQTKELAIGYVASPQPTQRDSGNTFEKT